MKTVRFREVVDKCGAPELHLSWTAPQKDGALQRAVRETRVLTVHQELRGSKKDSGTVGFIKDTAAQILIFPKSLKNYSDRHVVAIDYDLLAESKGAKYVRPPAPPPAASLPRVEHAEAPARKRSEPPQEKVARPAKALPEPLAGPPSSEELVAGIRQALRELKAGRQVAAYSRLQKLLAR